MEKMPQSNNLYRDIAKDFQPKQAAMNICKYIQQMEKDIVEWQQILITRIEELEKEVEQLKKAKAPAIPLQPKARSTSENKE